MFRSRLATAIAVSALTAVLVGGIAWAAIPDSATGVISACYPTSGTAKGALRVIDYQAGTRCKTGEALITWPSRGFRWRGLWQGTVAYGVNDVVQFNGSAFIAKLASTNVTPANATTWALLAAKGSTGAPGPARLDGIPCTSGTVAGVTQVTVDPSSDALTLLCHRPIATVGVTGGTLTKIIITDFSASTSTTCLAKSFCAFDLPFDHGVAFNLIGATSFHYTCRGLAAQVAAFDGTEFTGFCENLPVAVHYDLPVTIP